MSGYTLIDASDSKAQIRPGAGFGIAHLAVSGANTVIPINADVVDVLTNMDSDYTLPGGYDGQRLTVRFLMTDAATGTNNNATFTAITAIPYLLSGGGAYDYMVLEYLAAQSVWIVRSFTADAFPTGGTTSVGGGAPGAVQYAFVYTGLPPICLLATPVTVVPFAYWPADGTQYAAFPFQWTLTMTVTAQGHSSNATPTPFSYAASDIQVGDWFSNDGTQGMAWTVRSITSNDASNIVCVVEDVGLYNTHIDATTNGGGAPAIAAGFFFRLNGSGIPILTPSSLSEIGNDMASNLVSRFAYTNSLMTS